MEPVLFLLVGVGIGAAAAWIAAGSRFKSAGFARESEIRAAADAQIRELEQRAGAAEALQGELRQHVQ